MYTNTRIGKYLLLSAQLICKFPVIKIATVKFAHCNQFYKKYLQLSFDDTITSKCTAVINVTLGSQYKDIGSHHLPQAFQVNPVPARSFYICTENLSRTISSSTITYTTAVEDTTFTGAEMTQFSVIHDKDRKCFYIQMQEASQGQNKAQAKLEYEWVRPGLVDMYHTEVPPQYQGKGIAKILATAAFDAFSEQGVQMRPTCSYLQKYLRDNQIPRYLDHIEEGFVL